MNRDNQLILIILFITIMAIMGFGIIFSLNSLSNNNNNSMIIEETSLSMPSVEETSFIAPSLENTSSIEEKIAVSSETEISSSKESNSVSKSPERYPEAAQIWNILRSWDWTPETCAGIIGNMMAEVSGGDLDLSNWDLDDQYGFGLIQWTSGRRAAIKVRYGDLPTIEEQLEFMKDELFGTNDTIQQVSQKNLDIIMNIDKTQTPESIAMCFATYYERCAVQHRAKRQRYARKAYEYFINKYSESNN